MVTDILPFHDRVKFGTLEFDLMEANRASCEKEWQGVVFRSPVDAMAPPGCQSALADLDQGYVTGPGLLIIEFPWPHEYRGERKLWMRSLLSGLMTHWPNKLSIMLCRRGRDSDLAALIVEKRISMHSAICHYGARRMQDPTDSRLAEPGDLVSAFVIRPRVGCSWLPGQAMTEPIQVPELVLRCHWERLPVFHLGAYTLESPLVICQSLRRWQREWRL